MNAKQQLRKQRDTFHQVVTALVLRYGSVTLSATELAKAKKRTARVNVKSDGRGGVELELLGLPTETVHPATAALLGEIAEWGPPGADLRHGSRLHNHIAAWLEAGMPDLPPANPGAETEDQEETQP